jgi:endonuclease/exonuclease/phosphatase (EEP) superfamily protein YafD
VNAGLLRRGGQIAGVLAAVAAAAVGLSALAGVLSGGDWPWVVATYLRWPQVVVATLATAVLVGLRWWRSAMASAVVTMALVVSVVVPLAALDTVAAPAGQTLRIAVFNTGARNEDIRAIAAAIRSADPDVAVLLESEDVAVRVDRRLQDLSRLAPPVDGPVTSPPIVLAGHDWPVAVAPLAGGRPATVVTVDVGGQPLDIVAIHPLPPVTRAWARSHDQTISALTGDVLPRARPYVLACDCNSAPWSPSMRRLLDVGLHQPTVFATFGAPVVGIPIDHILLGRGVVAVSRELGPFAGSDHRLIVTEVAVRAGHDVAPAARGARSGAAPTTPARTVR